MTAQWRLFLAALHFVLRKPAAVADDSSATTPLDAIRFIPLAGVVVGAAAAATYWLSAQLWPTGVAVLLSLLATALCTETAGGVYGVFFVLIKYDTLLALSAARGPVPLPEFMTLGLIMIAGHAASRALLVSVMATHAPTAHRITHYDLALALIIGLAPAAPLGIPGLVGLAAAIAMRLGVSAYVLPRLPLRIRERLDITQQLTEICFYLGALATWKYV